MNSPVEFAINQIMTILPRELLEKAIKREYIHDTYAMASLEDKVKYHIFDQFLTPLLNAVGGQHVTIPIHDLPYRIIDNTWVYNIPISRTQGKHIIAYHAIENGYTDHGINQSAAQTALSVGMAIPSTGTARIKPGGPNILVVEEFFQTSNAYLRCTIANDEHFRNLNHFYHFDFTKLAVLAAKAFIHGRLTIAMGEGSETGGEASSYLRSELDGYGDAYQMMIEQIEEKWYRIMTLNDQKTKNRHIRMLLGNPR